MLAWSKYWNGRSIKRLLKRGESKLEHFRSVHLQSIYARRSSERRSALDQNLDSDIRVLVGHMPSKERSPLFIHEQKDSSCKTTLEAETSVAQTEPWVNLDKPNAGTVDHQLRWNPADRACVIPLPRLSVTVGKEPTPKSSLFLSRNH